MTPEEREREAIQNSAVNRAIRAAPDEFDQIYGTLLQTMTVEKKLAMFQQWQAAGYVHPLTCRGGGGDCTDTINLVPEIKQGLTVVGVCPQCHREQQEKDIPLCVWFINTLKNPFAPEKP